MHLLGRAYFHIICLCSSFTRYASIHHVHIIVEITLLSTTLVLSTHMGIIRVLENAWNHHLVNLTLRLGILDFISLLLLILSEIISPHSC